MQESPPWRSMDRMAMPAVRADRLRTETPVWQCEASCRAMLVCFDQSPKWFPSKEDASAPELQVSNFEQTLPPVIASVGAYGNGLTCWAGSDH